jgi:hypothetical protein
MSQEFRPTRPAIRDRNVFDVTSQTGKHGQDPDGSWGKGSDRQWTSSWRFRAGAAVFLLLLCGIVTILLWPAEVRKVDKISAPTAEDEIRDHIGKAEAVAKAFLAGGDPQERLRWVRDAEGVIGRMDDYSDEARETPAEIEKMIGHVTEDGRTVSAYAVAMPSGEMRLLEVVETDDGPKVDWDAYARYGTASWEDLLSGKAERAVVRVFCEPSSERPEPFGNQAEWTCFRLSSPDLPQAALGFAQVGSVREAMMKKVILGTPRYRQRFTLEILRHEGKDEPLFEITRCLAVGWILGERDVEEDWREKGK